MQSQTTDASSRNLAARCCLGPTVSSWQSVCCHPSCGARLTKDTTDWKNKKDMLDTEQAAQAHLQHQLAELNQEQLTAKVEAATAARDDAAAALQAAEQGVQAATRELAGVFWVAKKFLIYSGYLLLKCCSARHTNENCSEFTCLYKSCHISLRS